MARREPFAPFGITKRTQLITKSDQWLADVMIVYRHRRYAATLYLGGFVIECLLKAALWDQRLDARIRPLLFSHDLTALLNGAPQLRRELQLNDARLFGHFVLLASWTVRFRYNPVRIDRRDADAFVERLCEVRAWLRSRV